MEISFQRYLAAKQTVDDRALNGRVWQAMANALRDQPWDVLEIGAGIGTMIERLEAAGLLERARITAVDNQPENITTARERLARIGEKRPLTLETLDLFDLLDRQQGEPMCDLLIAHAFLDLMDIPRTLPRIFSLIRPGGYFYFTINFDGVTTFEPTIEPVFDELVERLYHRTMDERVTNGRVSGDSRSGRHLFSLIPQAGGQILAAGSSDWVVYGDENGYPDDEAYFLQVILHFFEQSLSGHPVLDSGQFAAWLAERRAQIERGELVYIAHQIDFFGRVAG